MKPRKDTVQIEKIKTPYGSVQKVRLPYLDWHIDPAMLQFNEKDPVNSIYNGKPILLGKGASGKVELIQRALPTEPPTYEWIAVKTYKPKATQALIDREINKLKETKIFIDSDFSDSTERKVRMKFLPGHELYESMIHPIKASPQNLSFSQKMVITKGIMKKIADLHHDAEKMKAEMKGEKKEKNVIFHRDIKPDNIRVDYRDMTVQYCDFGVSASIAGKPQKENPLNLSKEELDQLSTKDLIKRTEDIINLSKEKLDQLSTEDIIKALADTKPTEDQIAFGLAGTPMYIAPEILLSDSPTNEKTEIYALGVSLADFYHLNADVEDKRLLESKYPELYNQRYAIVDKSHPNAQKIPAELYTLISRMMDDDPAKRPTVVETNILLNQIFDKAGAPPPTEPDKRDDNKKNKIDPTNVGVISIADFQKMSEKKKLNCLAKIISQNINAVVLQGSETTTNQSYYEVCHYLNKKNIISIAPFMAQPDQALSNDKKEKVACYMAKEHYDQRLATVNTQAFIYDAKKQKFTERKPSFLSTLRTNAYAALTKLSETMKKKLGRDNAKTAEFIRHHEEIILYTDSPHKANFHRQTTTSSHEKPKSILPQDAVDLSEEKETPEEREVAQALACLKNNKEFYNLLSMDSTFRQNEPGQNIDYKDFDDLYRSLMRANLDEFRNFFAGVSQMNKEMRDEPMKEVLAKCPNYRKFLIDHAHHPAIENWYKRNPQPTREKKPDTKPDSVEAKHL